MNKRLICLGYAISALLAGIGGYLLLVVNWQIFLGIILYILGKDMMGELRKQYKRKDEANEYDSK